MDPDDENPGDHQSVEDYNNCWWSEWRDSRGETVWCFTLGICIRRSSLWLCQKVSLCLCFDWSNRVLDTKTDLAAMEFKIWPSNSDIMDWIWKKWKNLTFSNLNSSRSEFWTNFKFLPRQISLCANICYHLLILYLLLLNLLILYLLILYLLLLNWLILYLLIFYFLILYLLIFYFLIIYLLIFYFLILY